MTIFLLQHEEICGFPSKQFYDNSLKTDESVKKRPKKEVMNSFWPRGNRFPIMFVNVVGSVELGNAGRSATKTKVGKDSKHNIKEAMLAVSYVGYSGLVNRSLVQLSL